MVNSFVDEDYDEPRTLSSHFSARTKLLSLGVMIWGLGFLVIRGVGSRGALVGFRAGSLLSLVVAFIFGTVLISLIPFLRTGEVKNRDAKAFTREAWFLSSLVIATSWLTFFGVIISLFPRSQWINLASALLMISGIMLFLINSRMPCPKKHVTAYHFLIIWGVSLPLLVTYFSAFTEANLSVLIPNIILVTLIFTWAFWTLRTLDTETLRINSILGISLIASGMIVIGISWGWLTLGDWPMMPYLAYMLEQPYLYVGFFLISTGMLLQINEKGIKRISRSVRHPNPRITRESGSTTLALRHLILIVSWAVFSVFVITYSIVFQAHILAIFFFGSSYALYLIATRFDRLDVQQTSTLKRGLGPNLLRIMIMCILVLSFLWVSGETSRLHDDDWIWDDLFLYLGLTIGGFFAGITSKTIHTALLSSLIMSVAVSLSASLFWAQDIGEFESGFLLLIAFSIIGMVPARIIREIRRRINERRAPPWVP